MLKLGLPEQTQMQARPAAFRRLCVETATDLPQKPNSNPAAFRRLCVETIFAITLIRRVLPAAFRRLCVETDDNGTYRSAIASSRL